MPIVNLTPHAVSLYHASHLAGQPLAFCRTSGGFLLVGRLDSNEHFLPYGSTRWPAASSPARVSEIRSEVSRMEYPDLEYQEGPGRGPDGCGFGDTPVTGWVPTRTVTHGPVTGLPDPVDGTYLIVSLPVVQALQRSGARTTSDLLTVGDLVRDPHGEIAGVTSFYRW